MFLLLNSLRLGGSQTYFLELAKRMTRNGFKVVLIANPGVLEDSFKKQGVKVVTVRWLEGRANEPWSLRRLILGLFTILIGLYFFILIKVANPAAVIASQPWPTHFATRWTPKRIKIFAIVHGFTAVEFPPPKEKRTINRIDRVFSVSDETSRFLQTSYSIEALTIGNLFSADNYWNDFKEGLNSTESKQILCLATLTPNKVDSIEAAIYSLSLLPGWSLSIAGDGPELENLTKLASILGINDRVTFLGGLSDPRAEILKAAVVVGVGRVALEAMSGGIPVVIASDGKIFGKVTPENLINLANFNYTARGPEAKPLTAVAFAEAVLGATGIAKSEVRRLANLCKVVGNDKVIVQALDE